MEKLNNLKWTRLFFALGIIGGIALYFSYKPKFASTGALIIKRPLFEVAGNPDPEKRNRWVWIRDGLSLKKQFLSDEELIKMTNTLPVVKAEKEKFINEWKKKHKGLVKTDSQIELKYIYSKVIPALNLTFTGADEHSYKLMVLHKDPTWSFEVAEYMLNNMRTMAISRGTQTFNEIKKALKESDIYRPKDKTKVAKIKAQELKDLTLKKLEESFILQNVQRRLSTQVLEKPQMPHQAHGPRKALLVAVIIFGLVILGNLLDVLVSLKNGIRFNEGKA